MGTAILILLLLALCGFIAYLGDLLGRRLGKKRLSVFGLRPKHTAILLTVVTGVVIAAVTFGMAMLSVPSFRKVVIQGERLSAQNTRLRSANRQLDGEIRQRTEQNAKLENRNGELARANAGFITENRKLQTSNRKLLSDNERLGSENAQLSTANRSLGSQNTELRTANAGLKTRNGSLEQKSTELMATNRRLIVERDAIRKDRERFYRQVTTLRGEISNLATVANNYRREQYLFRRNQLIEDSSQMIPANPPADVMRRSIEKAVYGAVTTVKRYAPRSAITWVKPEGYPVGRSQTLSSMEDWVVTLTSRQKDKTLAVQVVAHENCVDGRAVPLRLEWYVNDLVYLQDEVVATSGLIDGAGEEGQILGELINFLKVKVGPTAAEHMATGADSVGELSYKQLLPVCRKIKSAGSFVIIAAVAKQNTLRSGPLNIYLDVRTPNTSALNSK